LKINWRLIIGVVLSVGALALILKDTDLAALWNELLKANYAWLIPAAAVQLAAMWFRAYRWQALLDDRLPFMRTFHIGNVGNFLNNVLPFRMGEFGRAYLASRNSSLTVMQSLSTVLIERLLDVLSVFAFLIGVLPFVPGESIFAGVGLATAVIAFLAVVGLFVAAAVRERAIALARALSGWLKPGLREALLSRADDFLQGVHAAGGRRLLRAIFWSVLVWICWNLSAQFALWCFVPEAPWAAGLFVNCALALGLALPSAPSGVGIYEGVAVAALGVFGIPLDVALAYGVVSHLFGIAVYAVFGVIGLDREGESFQHLAASAQNLLASTRAK
jgi:glycosyltransferase 2 family protein